MLLKKNIIIHPFQVILSSNEYFIMMAFWKKIGKFFWKKKIQLKFLNQCKLKFHD